MLSRSPTHARNRYQTTTNTAQSKRGRFWDLSGGGGKECRGSDLFKPFYSDLYSDSIFRLGNCFAASRRRRPAHGSAGGAGGDGLHRAGSPCEGSSVRPPAAPAGDTRRRLVGYYVVAARVAETDDSWLVGSAALELPSLGMCPASRRFGGE
eukprot:1194499-Prorocentrum_minimum.AAC.1